MNVLKIIDGMSASTNLADLSALHENVENFCLCCRKLTRYTNVTYKTTSPTALYEPFIFF